VITEAQNAVYFAKKEAEKAAYIAAYDPMNPWAAYPAYMPPIPF
jgi:hypothetical protein